MGGGTDGYREVSVGEVVPHRGAKRWDSYVLMCGGRENREMAPLREASDSARDLTRVQYPLRVDGEGYGGCFKT